MQSNAWIYNLHIHLHIPNSIGVEAYESQRQVSVFKSAVDERLEELCSFLYTEGSATNRGVLENTGMGSW